MSSSDGGTEADKVISKEVKGLVSKTWVFRHSNYTSDDEKFFNDLEKTYMVYGREIGPLGTPHLQGTITFVRGYRISQLKKLSPNTHWETAKAIDSQNYCMKDRDYVLDDRRKQGSRTELSTAIDLAREGGIKSVAQNKPVEYVKYRAGIESLIQLEQPERNFKPHVIWAYGPTGTGKTRTIYDVFGCKTEDVWISPKNLNTWFAYENQPIVVLDEFRNDSCSFHELLKILDRYPYNVKVNYGHRVLNSHFIFITSPYHPKDVYDTEERIDQLIRRIDRIFRLAVDQDKYKDHMIKYKVILDLIESPRFKKSYVPPVVFQKKVIKEHRNYFRIHNLLIKNFKEDFKRLRLLSSGLF